MNETPTSTEPTEALKTPPIQSIFERQNKEAEEALTQLTTEAQTLKVSTFEHIFHKGTLLHVYCPKRRTPWVVQRVRPGTLYVARAKGAKFHHGEPVANTPVEVTLFQATCEADVEAGLGLSPLDPRTRLRGMIFNVKKNTAADGMVLKFKGIFKSPTLPAAPLVEPVQVMSQSPEPALTPPGS